MPRDTESYKKSNETIIIPNLKISQATKDLYHELRGLTRITQVDLQTFADLICDDLGITRCYIHLKSRQPHQHTGSRLKQKTMGKYNPVQHSINIFKFTAVKQKEIAPKTAIETLLHELNHHIDFTVLMLRGSLHTTGFYKRLTYLKDNLRY